ncbi:unnamed protein product [Rotaria magnacalcarata]
MELIEVNYKYLSLLVDYMTYEGVYKLCNRFGSELGKYGVFRVRVRVRVPPIRVRVRVRVPPIRVRVRVRVPPIRVRVRVRVPTIRGQVKARVA